MTIQEAIKKLWLLRNKYECLTYKEAEKISITNAEFVDAIQVAIEALEKQTPKKPIGDGIYRYCPVCSRDVGYIDALAEAKLKYCNDCGQAIDWSEE